MSMLFLKFFYTFFPSRQFCFLRVFCWFIRCNNLLSPLPLCSTIMISHHARTQRLSFVVQIMKIATLKLNTLRLDSQFRCGSSCRLLLLSSIDSLVWVAEVEFHRNHWLLTQVVEAWNLMIVTSHVAVMRHMASSSSLVLRTHTHTCVSNSW